MSSPVKVVGFTSFKIVRVRCGDEMSVFLNSNGDLFSCGWRSDVDQDLNTYTPLKIDIP